MTQLNIFEIQEQIPPQKTRLVDKHYMHNLEWEVYEELKTHLTKDFAIKADELAEMFETNTRQLREVITILRSKQNAKIIGDSNGYYIGTVDEFDAWIKARIKRTLSSLKTTLDLTPKAKNIMYWFLNGYKNEGIAQGQSQLKYNGWEREFIRQFAEDYMGSEAVQ